MRTSIKQGCIIVHWTAAWIALCTIVCVGATQAAIAATPQVLAFPGAEGFGARATGGRGGRVLIVDSLADDPINPARNTFRWACESEGGPRIVVFRTGGIIELARPVVIRNAHITIAGQTAPGDG